MLDEEKFLLRLTDIIRPGHDKLKANWQNIGGACAFLGKNIKGNGILMLGLNPGGDGDEVECKPQEANCLLERAEYRYWINARKVFGADEHVRFSNADALRGKMSGATFSFCIPFRTQNFSLPKQQKAELLEASTPFLLAILEYCRPSAVIVAGVTARRAFCEMVGSSDNHLCEQKDGRIWQWGSGRLDAPYNETLLVQIPHLSRANGAERQAKVGEWLAGQLKAG